MGCLISLPETDTIPDEILYIPGVDFYTEPFLDDYEVDNLFFLYD
jgi:hypothetical protein|tara:strand:- start:231 stop:365 length:135 start_codon:yes stop_codon:yes gene_type:complete